MFSWYKYLIVGLVFSHLGFWSGSLFLIAPFPDLCLLVLFQQGDRVPHERILLKLDHYGMRGRTLDWIRVFLMDRTQKVTVERVASEPVHVKRGVTQGSVSGPVLFLVFINDLPASINPTLDCS